jgi:hypothetical protein
MTTDKPDRIERTLELLLYASLGVGLFLKETTPTFIDMFVARGRAEIDRRQGDVQQRVTSARSLGQVALAFGPPMLRARVDQTVADARRRAEGLFGSPASSPAPPRREAPAPPATAAPPEWKSPPSAPAVNNGDPADSAELPIPGYDALSASQVVERLIGLAPDELDAVHAYESSHRQRRTILGKIEQLAG